jgi:hypothetical protein
MTKKVTLSTLSFKKVKIGKSKIIIASKVIQKSKIGIACGLLKRISWWAY